MYVLLECKVIVCCCIPKTLIYGNCKLLSDTITTCAGNYNYQIYLEFQNVIKFVIVSDTSHTIHC